MQARAAGRPYNFHAFNKYYLQGGLALEFFENLPKCVQTFLAHKLTIEGKSKLTVKEYGYDLQTFLRFMVKKPEKNEDDLKKVNISHVDIEFIKKITLSDVYEYLMFLSVDLNNGIKARARKLAAIKAFYKYLTVKTHIIEFDIVKDIEIPKIGKALPKYLELDESKQLLDSIDGKTKERDFLMLSILLNCGLRVSELQKIKLKDIKSDRLTVTGKGNKQRQLFLNEITIDALSEYLSVRPQTDISMLFLSCKGEALSIPGIQYIVKNLFRKAGLDAASLSTHKLRHTAATLMYRYGNVDIKTLQSVLGHENINTTEIYTHTDDKMVKEAIEKNPLSTYKKKG